MTRQEQIDFVNDLCDAVKNDIKVRIAKDFVPENWDGIELRQYIADKFQDCIAKKIMTKSRKRDYNNTILVNNL